MNTKSYKSLLVLLITLLSFGGAKAQALNSIPDTLIKLILDKKKQTTRVTYNPSLRKNILAVTATAYTSHPNQTDSTPNIAAWGDKLRPGMKVVAVSRDLLDKYGLTRGSKIKIHGLPGQYLVLDKMNKRWKKKIDIYMGKSKREAFKWGRRKVTIEWQG